MLGGGGGSWVGNAGSSTVGDKYVPSTRFVSIGSGTSGAVTLPSNSEVLLDDFGGAVDAVVLQIASGKPLQIPALTAAGAVVATTFDSSGNWAFTGTPVAYPVALVYRVRQQLKNYDSTAADIWGGDEFHSVLPIADGGTGATTAAGARANLGITSGSTPKQELITGVFAAGNTTYTLTETPAAAEGVLAVLGTNPQAQGTNYTILGKVITFAGEDTTASLLLAFYTY